MLVLGRYALGEEIARGGIASVHLGLVLGDAGFSRPVAIKRLLPAMVNDPDLAASFLDEARLASRVRHPNVVSTLDVREQDGELFLVLEYVHGESLANLVAAAAKAGERIPLPIVVTIVAGALRGLSAAHEAKDELGQALGIVHRDVTPHNVIVGVDGVARVIDFGIAKAASRGQITREGQVKGKLGYLAPEQLGQQAVPATDLYGAGVCLWEALTGERAFDGGNESAILAKVMAGMIARPSKHVPGIPPELDRLVLRALDRDPTRRFASGDEMAAALEAIVGPASPAEVGAFVGRAAEAKLAERAARIASLVAERDASIASGGETDAAGDAAPATHAAAPPVARKRALPLFVAGFVTIAVLGVWFATRNGATPSPEPNAATTVTERPAGPAAARARVEPARGATDAPAETEAATPGVEQDPPATSEDAPSRKPPARAAAARRARSPQTKPKCDPPYSIDRDGVRRYKKECLE